MLLAWQGDGQEVTRHMVEGSIEMRLGILLVLLIAALARRSNDALEQANELDSGAATGLVSSGASSAARPNKSWGNRLERWALPTGWSDGLSGPF